MRRYILILVAITATLLAYPNLAHPPLILSPDGWISVNVEFERPTQIDLKVIFDDDEFDILTSSDTVHRIFVPLLREFSYELRVGDRVLKRGRVIPPRAVENDFSFAVYGDSRWGKRVHERIIEMVNDSNIPFLFNLGDLVSLDINDSDWMDFFDVVSKYKGVLFTVRGNHDSGFRYNRFLYPDVYSVRIGRIRFLILDSNSILFKNDLESQLKVFQDENTFKILMFHHVIFSCGPHGQDIDTLMRRSVHEIIKRMGVKLVFTSHDHNYQRLEKDGVTYVVTGGGGAALYSAYPERNCTAKLVKYCKCHHFIVGELKGNTLRISVQDLSGKVIDEFSFDLEEGTKR